MTSQFIPGKTLVPIAGCPTGQEEITYLADVALRGHYTAGHYHKRLERELAAWYGVKHARLTNSGSSANLLALAALELPRGSEVITLAAGFPTTIAPIVQLGLVPVFVDVEIPSYNVNVEELPKAFSKKTRAVFLAHTLGNPFNVDAVRRFCLVNDLRLIEDNCDAAGAVFRGRRTGTFGDLGTLSFYPAHHMTTGEGGAVLTDDDDLARIVTSLRDWGRDCHCPPNCDNTCGKRFDQKHGDLPHGYDHKYVYSRFGYNFKMTEMQAAIGVAQLGKLDQFVAERRFNWNRYRLYLDDLSDRLILPEFDIHSSTPSPFGFAMTMREGFDRNAIVRALERRRIQTRMLFAGNIIRHPAMEGIKARKIGDLRNSDMIMERTFWIGVAPTLTEEMRSWVVQSLHEVTR